MSAWHPEPEGLWHQPLRDGWEAAPWTPGGPPPPESAFRPVPGPVQWGALPGFGHGVEGAVYRVAFALAPTAPSRLRLTAGGVFYWSRWELDGALLGTSEGYFVPFDRPWQPGPAAVHRLVVWTACRAEPHPLAKEQVLGIFAHWDCLPPGFSAGGPWLGVELWEDPPLRLAAPQVSLTQMDRDRALGQVRVRVFAQDPGAAELTLSLTDAEGRSAHEGRHALRLLGGEQVLTVPLAVDQPIPWEPAARGTPHLYRLRLELEGPSGDSRITFPVGLRTVRLDRRRRLMVNGQPLHIKGLNYGPSTALLGHTDRPRVEADLADLLAHGVNLVRVHGHIGHPELYAAADRMGMLIWQDFPLQWLYRPAVRRPALRQAAAMVHQLARHPSIVLWCMHNEPAFVPAPEETRPGPMLRSLASILLFSPNRDLLDPVLARQVRRLDPTRPVFAHSGLLSRTGRSDSHLYLGWYPGYGPLRNLDTVRHWAPWVLRWVSEFGAQSLPSEPTARGFIPERLTPADWDRLSRHHLAQPGLLRRALGDLGPERDRWIAQSQEYQAWLNGVYIDRLRAAKYRPNAAILAFFYRDAVPGVSWSLVDHEGHPKRAWDALKAQYAPVTCVALLPLTPPFPWKRAELWAVSDAPEPLRLKVKATLDGPGPTPQPLGSWWASLPPDASVAVARLAWEGEGDWLTVQWQAEDGAHRGARRFPLRPPGAAGAPTRPRRPT